MGDRRWETGGGTASFQGSALERTALVAPPRPSMSHIFALTFQPKTPTTAFHP